MQTTDLQACIYTDGRRQDGRTVGLTNERKENIQTDRITNNITKLCIQADRRTHGRTDTYTDNTLTGRQTDGQNIQLNYNHIRTGGRIDHRIEGQFDKHFIHAHRHSHIHAKIKYSWSERNSFNQCLMKSFAQLNYVVRTS